MSSLSWSDIDQNVHPAPQWLFTVTFPTIPGSSVSGQTLSFLVERCSMPHKGIEYETAAYQASYRNFPTLRTVGIVSFTFVESISYDVALAFRAWVDAVIDDDGNFGLPATYKQQISLVPQDETGSNTVTFAWKDCSPQSLDDFDFDGTQTGHIPARMSLVVDNPVAPVAA